MQHITAVELAAWIADPTLASPLLLDVREPWEHQICHIADSQLMPLQTVRDHLNDLEEEQPIVCICHHGVRSLHVAAFLEKNGFCAVSNLTGGIHAWAQQVDADMPLY